MYHRKKYYGEIVVKSPLSSIQGSPLISRARLDRSNSLGVDILTKSPGRTGGFALWSGVDKVDENSSLLEGNTLYNNDSQDTLQQIQNYHTLEQ